MKKTIVVFILSVCVINAGSYAAIFSDNFESGTLSQWSVETVPFEGGQSTAGIVTRNSSHMAHLYQKGMQNVLMTKTFGYQENMNFSFYMETQVHSDSPIPDGESYASAVVSFYFLDTAANELGYVRYGSSTSTWPASIQNPYPNKQVFHTYGPLAAVYSLDVESILSNITIDQNALAFVKMQFVAYASGTSYNMSAHTWVDNVTVTPEPATVMLLFLGGLALRYRKS